MTVADDALETYFAAVQDVDVARASDLVLRMLDEGSAVDTITRAVLAPAQVRAGELWQQGTWSVADEHAATAVTESALAALAAATRRPTTSTYTHVVVACAEGEWHTLPAGMAAAVAASGGVRVTVLGPSVPPDHLGRRLSGGDVDLLALSCTLAPNLLGAARCVRAAHEAGVPVVVGGLAFGADASRAEAIGADAWATDPAALAHVPELRSCADPEVPVEAVLLDTVDDTTVAMAFDRLVGTFPRLASMTSYQQSRTREDLRWMARYAGAAVLTGDVSVLEDFLDWLRALLSGRVPSEVITTSAHVVADTVEPFAPSGAEGLRTAAAGLERASA